MNKFISINEIKIYIEINAENYNNCENVVDLSKVEFRIFCFRLNLVFFILILHGIGALMPWNMFITAKDVSRV